MLLLLTCTTPPATDVGYLLHKDPRRAQSFSLPFGTAHVFYPEASDERCTAALLVDVDPIELVRGRRGSVDSGMLDQYVNDRPYASSSLLSVAMSRVFGTALGGRCSERPGLVDTPLELTARIVALPCRGGRQLIGELFEPLGYEVTSEGAELDPAFPDWGPSPYYTVELRRLVPLRDLLRHLYVLIPVLDNAKHYWVGPAEVEKLLKRGEGWLSDHPAKEFIARRYLRHQYSLTCDALARLADESADPEAAESQHADEEAATEAPLNLNEQRIGSVIAVLRSLGAKRVLDLGCGEGRLLRAMLADRSFEYMLGLDVSARRLGFAAKRLRLERMPDRQRSRIGLIHSSLMYRDKRLEGFDAAAVLEVVEHLDSPRLASFERVLFECAGPQAVVLTTPNREYNVMWEDVGPDKLRHRDHRFEWTRAEFRVWAEAVAERRGYNVRFLPIGAEDPAAGPPTQMGVFTRPGL